MGANGVLYLPYLSVQGITAPFAEPTARAEFFGLTDKYMRADMLRSIYEGLALSIRDGYAVMNAPIDTLYLHKCRPGNRGRATTYLSQFARNFHV